LYEVEARYTTSGSQSPFQVSLCVPRRRPHPGKIRRSTTRWLSDTAPNWSCNSICNLTQFNAVSRKCPQVREDSRKPLQIPAD
jgi:hypothetical protein